MQGLPTESQINVFDSLDERCAVKHFFGKSLEEAKSLFQENFLYFQEDLMFMGPVGFAYYVQAAIEYLLSDAADGDADAANTFYGLIRFRFEQEPETIEPVRPLVLSALKAIHAKFDRFCCVTEIYGDLSHAYKMLIEQLSD
ncbi:MAG: hypothetical protein RJA81_1465 [Planctomycetota bacterium]|jgi:hypothetical protein